jgi:NADH:ubiquinone oxidoreductase subunit 6 (subunit J)
LWLIIASLILLLAMIGAIAITTTPKYLDDKKK